MSGPAPALTFSLVLPLPPSINSQYVTVGRKRVLSKGAKAFHKEVKAIFLHLRESGRLAPHVDARFADSLLGVYFTFFFETPMRRDLDGGLKIALDALGENLGFDDRTVVDIHLIKRIDPLRPRLEVEIETIAEWSFDRDYVYLGDAADNDV